MGPRTGALLDKMMTTAFVLLLALAFLIFLVSLMRRRRLESDPIALYRQLQPIHLPALLNLLNPDDLNFLRANLRRSEFVKLKRERTRSLIEYVRKIASNAKVLTSIGAISQHSPLPEVAAAGQALSTRALVTRIRALRALMSLWIELFLPFLDTNLGTTISAYEAANSRLQGIDPASVVPR